MISMRIKRAGSLVVLGVLSLLSACLGVSGFVVMAQSPAPHIDGGPVIGQIPAPNGFWLLGSSALTTFGAIAYAWINADRASLTRRAEKAEQEAQRCAAEAQRLKEDRDLWMRRAYKGGYNDPEIPTARGPEMPR
jgi:hypothetical protein